jgi:signal peptidase I
LRGLMGMRKEDHVLAAQRSAGGKKEEGLWETAKVIVQALAIAFFIRTFFYQPFNIPSPSMYPTLKVGDYLFVSKLSYGYGKYSFNFSLGLGQSVLVDCCPFDFTGRKFLPDVPQRGDVAVFKLPTDTNIDYIKRVIGLPGDRIQMKDGVLHINDVAVPKVRIADYVDGDPESGLGGRPIPQFEETLPNGVKYTVLDEESAGAADNTEVYVVPANHYFMMGDNRDNSQDSRYLDAVGFVPIENYVGRAEIIFFSISTQARIWEVWKWPVYIRWLRFFNLL